MEKKEIPEEEVERLAKTQQEDEGKCATSADMDVNGEDPSITGCVSRSARGRMQKMITVEVECLTGQKLIIDDIYGIDKLLTLKQRIEENERIPTEQQRLLFSTKLLSDDTLSLFEYGIKSGAVLQLVVRSKSLKEHHRRWSATTPTDIVNFDKSLGVEGSNEEVAKGTDPVRERYDSSNSVFSEGELLRAVNHGDSTAEHENLARRSDNWFKRNIKDSSRASAKA